jgi:alanyl-tRNA synthetase
MNSATIRQKFLDFFKERGHVVIPSASLVPENDRSILFTTAGMQPLVPYLMGEPHPQGKRLVNIQKCVRTQDIEEVGDNTHDTFFEMLGNWSLGDYFKEEAIKWSYELLTSKEEGFGLDPKRLYITIFEGKGEISPDEEAKKVWLDLGIPEHRIYYKGVADNWWPAVKGEDIWTGPTGPDTEMFYDITPEGLGDLSPQEFSKADDEQKVVEIWNDVFMQYEKKDGEIIGELKVKNVDTGAGLERLAMVLQKKDNIFETDLFASLLTPLDKLETRDVRAQRIVVDHIRTSSFLISDGVLPSNTDRGYVLRRLLRRAYLYVYKMGGNLETLKEVISAVINHESYRGLYIFDSKIEEIISNEITKFEKTLASGLKMFEKDVDPFVLFTSYGFPIELTEEIAHERGIDIDRKKFDEEMEKHKRLSQIGGEKKFKK